MEQGKIDLSKALTKDVMQQWANALRSGTYVQCDIHTRKVVDGVCKHCVVGVLQDILSPNTWKRREWDTDYESYVNTAFGSVYEVYAFFPELQGIVGNNDNGWKFDELSRFIESKIDAIYDSSNDGVLSETDEDSQA